ncbi:MAG: hypothetical protein O2975_05935 [Proteobacteria bacterium]|nr:hypothetical protein [Pseudomonadota bacterium]
MNQVLLDPTFEASASMRERRAPPATLAGRTVGFLDIGKARGNVFLDRLEARLTDRGIAVKRYAKPTNARTAPIPVLDAITEECDVVVDALSD